MQSLPLALIALALPALGQGIPDVAVSEVASHGDWRYYGNVGGVAAYSFATTSCNVGTAPVAWNPMVAQNLFRIVDGRIEQIGYSFVVEKFCAINEASCGTCQPTSCSTLGVGCADTTALNDGAFGVGKWAIDATRATWTAPLPAPCCDDPVVRGRLQVELSSLGAPGAAYVAEAQYVSAPDHQAGLSANNQSWRFVDLSSFTQPTSGGSTVMFEPAVMAWRDVHPDVQVAEAFVLDEGGPGVHGVMWVASRATDLGGGLWRYDYAVQNQTSNRAVGRFSVPLSCPSTAITSPASRGVRHHGGSPYSDTAWTTSPAPGSFSWRTEDFGANPNANAVRWGNLYAFGLVSDGAPDPNGTVELGLFTPGTPGVVTARAFVPAGADFTSFCTATANSSGAPASLSGTGTLAANTVELTATSLPSNNFGYFLMSEMQAFVPLPPGSSGNLCLGGSIVRFSGHIQSSGPLGVVVFAPDVTNLPGGATWDPGESWSFQYWTRDGVGPSNFSDGTSTTFCQ